MAATPHAEIWIFFRSLPTVEPAPAPAPAPAAVPAPVMPRAPAASVELGQVMKQLEALQRSLGTMKISEDCGRITME